MHSHLPVRDFQVAQVITLCTDSVWIAPPTNESLFHQWTIGPVFYSTLAVAETFGTSGQSQIIDIQANGGNIFTPGYAVYDGGALSKVALFNYVTDPSGASDYTATITTVSGTMPSQVFVK